MEKTEHEADSEEQVEGHDDGHDDHGGLGGLVPDRRPDRGEEDKPREAGTQQHTQPLPPRDLQEYYDHSITYPSIPGFLAAKKQL